MLKLNNKPRSAFTVIELVVVVGIIGILAAISIPRFIGMVCRAREAAVALCAKAVRDDYIAHYNSNIADKFAEFTFAGKSQSCVDKLEARCVYDVNSDRTLDMQDPTIIMNLLTKLELPEQDMAQLIRPKFVYDQNGDGAITAMDLLIIRNKLFDPEAMKRY